jgi:hypothetical protein
MCLVIISLLILITLIIMCTELEPVDIPPFLEAEERLRPPQYCPDPIIKLMQQCWEYHPRDRPHFDILAEQFYALLCIEYRRRYEGVVRRLNARNASIQNTMYHLMTSATASGGGGLQRTSSDISIRTNDHSELPSHTTTVETIISSSS